MRELTNTSEISFDPKEGFIRVTALKGRFLDLNSAKNDFTVASRMLNYKKTPVLADSRYALEHTKESRDFYSSKEVSEKITAMAVLVDSIAMKLIVNFFINFNKPHFPTKLFNKKSTAEKWLYQFVKK